MTPPRKDPSRTIKTYTSEETQNMPSIPPQVVDRALSKKIAEWPKWAAIIITLISMIVGAAVWASAAHEDLQAFTLEHDYMTEADIKSIIKDQYVQKAEFAAVEQCMKDQKLTLDKIEAKLDRLLEQPRLKDR